MSQTEIIRLCAIYLPLTLCLIAGIWLRSQRKCLAAFLLSALWTVPTLLVVARMNAIAQWWSFSDADASLAGMPIELYLGWILLWGALPQLISRRVSVLPMTFLFIALDLVAMPFCQPVVQLHSRWLVGEAVAALLVLLPALCLGRWTATASNLNGRAALQVVLSGLLFLYLLPELVFALRPSTGWHSLLSMPGWQRQLALQCIALLALPGLGAVMEFAQRGLGTPIPYDPPTRLVSSGLYRYCANPMQLSCTLVTFAWSALLQNPWLLPVPLVGIIYGIGIARWSEAQDLRTRFGDSWQSYRGEVHDWFPRWKPYHSGDPAKLYVAFSCGPCSELRAWVEARKPFGLQIMPAESLPSESIRRLRYEPSDGTPHEEGIRALGRSLEHINFFWALAGSGLRLPVVCQFVQLVMDASGFGPQVLTVCSSEPNIRKL